MKNDIGPRGGKSFAVIAGGLVWAWTVMGQAQTRPEGRSGLDLLDLATIRFDKELRWLIDWKNETFGKRKGWVDYATVFYWYQDSPGGYRHEPLPPVRNRYLDILPESGR